jgi:hypothetical protein
VKHLTKIEITVPEIPMGYEYTGEYRQAIKGDYYLKRICKTLTLWSEASSSTSLYVIIKKVIEIIDPFDSSQDIDLEFSNNGGKWYLFNRRDMALCKNAPYAYRNTELCLDFQRCRVRQNHRIVCVEGTKLPEGLRCVTRNPATGFADVSISAVDPCDQNKIANVEIEGSSTGYKYEWE